MKLSEAIREGAKLRPQSYDAFFSLSDPDPDRGRVCSCALGAAYEASGGTADINIGDRVVLETMLRAFPALYERADDPINPRPNGVLLPRVRNIIQNLNDDGKWSREAIADWLEGLGL